MENIGRILKEAREHLNKSHEEIHIQTKISVDHLKFLEENNFAFLPETYVKAFLRTYARTLGLDDNQILRKYLENQEEKRKAEEELNELTSSEPKPGAPTNLNLEWSLGFGALVLIFSVIFVSTKYKSQIFEKPPNLVKGTPVEEVRDKDISTNQQPQTEKESLSSPLGLEITAIEKVWLRLTIDNNKVNEYTLAPGNKLIWIAQNRFEMLIGNAGAINVNFNGRKLSTLGASGEPVRLVITKDGLIEREIVTNAQRPETHY